MSLEQVTQTLQEFGKGAGLRQAKLSEEGVACYKIQSIGTLCIEMLDDDTVAIYLARELLAPASQYYRRMLRLTDIYESLPYLVQVALKDENTAVFMARIATDQLLLPQFEEIIALLTGLHDRLSGRH